MTIKTHTQQKLETARYIAAVISFAQSDDIPYYLNKLPEKNRDRFIATAERMYQYRNTGDRLYRAIKRSLQYGVEF